MPEGMVRRPSQEREAAFEMVRRPIMFSQASSEKLIFQDPSFGSDSQFATTSEVSNAFCIETDSIKDLPATLPSRHYALHCRDEEFAMHV